MRYTLLALALLLSFNGAHAAMSAEDKAKLKEESLRFADEGAKMREDQMISVRDLRIDHIKQLYDLKIKQQHEVDALYKQMAVGDKETNEKIKAEVKQKQDAFKIEEKKFNDDFTEKVLKPKHADFKILMEKRREEFRNSHKK